MKVKQDKIRLLENEGFYHKPIRKVILHNIPANRKVCGIYKIMFGEKFYIGQSFHVGKRMKQHRAEINKIFCSGTPSGKKANIINHLKENTEIDSMDVFVLEECNESNLQNTEQKWLSEYKNDSHCLNSNFTSFTTPHVAAANKFKPVTVKTEFVFNTKREVSLYEKFLSELNQVRINPRVNLNKWY